MSAFLEGWARLGFELDAECAAYLASHNQRLYESLRAVAIECLQAGDDDGCDRLVRTIVELGLRDRVAHFAAMRDAAIDRLMQRHQLWIADSETAIEIFDQ